MNPEDPSLLGHDSIVTQERDQRDGCTKDQNQVWEERGSDKDGSRRKVHKGAHAEEDHSHKLRDHERREHVINTRHFIVLIHVSISQKAPYQGQ